MIQKKYYYTFKSLNNDDNTVEIWQDTTNTITAEEVRCADTAFNVELLSLNHKFDVVHGTGCEFNLVSDSNMKFFTSLYHINPKEFMIKHYINSGISWLGYMNSELFSETYSKLENYPVTVTGNDGFSLLNRLKFIQSNNTKYTGIKSKFDLIRIIFDSLGLPLNELRISLSTTFTGYSNNANSTILHESYIHSNNFYDEDDIAFTLRRVLEGILQPYGAVIFQQDGNIYITDINTLAANTSITYKRYSFSNYSYIADIAINNRKTINDIGYAGTGQGLEISGGVNKQIVKYSPYPTKLIIENSISSLDEFSGVPSSFTSYNGYYIRTLTGNEYWDSYSPTSFQESYYTDASNPDLYYKIVSNPTSVKIAELKYKPSLNVSGVDANLSNGLSIFISGEICPVTRTNFYNENETSKDVSSIALEMKIKFGDYYLTPDISGNLNLGDKWVTSDSKFIIYNDDSPQNSYRTNIADKWVDMGRYGEGINIKLGNRNETINFNGELSIEFYSTYWNNKTTNGTYVKNSTDVKEIWIKNLSVKLINRDKTEISDDDREVQGTNLDQNFENEGDVIELICGTDYQYSDRGKIMKSDGVDITSWSRGSNTNKIEELLVGSVTSNYKAGFIKLNGMILKNNFKMINILSDSYLTDKLFMVQSSTINYRENTANCSLVEISQDDFTII